MSAAAYGSDSVHRKQTTSLPWTWLVVLVNVTAGGIPRSHTISRPCRAAARQMRRGVAYRGSRYAAHSRPAEFSLAMVYRQ